MKTKEEKQKYIKSWEKAHKEERKLYWGKRRGYMGMYKDKQFRYKVKLPEGKVRHHIFYNDSNPNEGIVYVSRGEHLKIHLERGEVRGGIKTSYA